MSTIRIYSNLETEVYRSLRDIDKYDKATQAKLRAALVKGTNEVRDYAKSRVPVRSGRLKAQIYSDFNAKGNQGIVHSKGRHAHLVEFGAGPGVVTPRRRKALKIGDKYANFATIPRRAAHPYMRSAAEGKRPEVEKLIKEAVILR